MSEPFLGEIRMFGFNFNPRSWAYCSGQLLPIAQNSALFSLLGTIYGGDGRTSFALPDLRGRVPIHEGSGPGLSHYPLGSRGGAETTTLGVANLPSHNHSVSIPVNSDSPNVDSPSGHYLSGGELYQNAPGSNEFYGNGLITDNTGGGQSFNNRQPFLTLNFCIALQGLFPSRS